MGKEMRLGNILVRLGNAQGLEDFEAVVSVLFSAGQFVMVRHKDRGWEFPGGRRQGNETYQETAAREILEETGARIKEIQGMGHYVDSAGRLTVIAYAEVSSFEATPEPGEITELALFKEIPGELSFADGREQLFLEYARETRSRRRD
ncbi:MAG: NUDIX domain-containing protein [Anaerolineales bacterium]